MSVQRCGQWIYIIISELNVHDSNFAVRFTRIYLSLCINTYVWIRVGLEANKTLSVCALSERSSFRCCLIISQQHLCTYWNEINDDRTIVMELYMYIWIICTAWSMHPAEGCYCIKAKCSDGLRVIRERDLCWCVSDSYRVWSTIHER